MSGLLVSAKEFLVESLINYGSRKRSFAILHAVIATEMVLKERLARIHPLLVYKNIDAKDLRAEPSVGMASLPKRLANLGVRIDGQDEELIRTCVEWRNQIVHHLPSFDAATADLQLPRLLDFLALFMRLELATPIESFLPPDLYRTAEALLGEWRRVVVEAAERAGATGTVLPIACPDCGSSGILTRTEDCRTYCHLCRSSRFHYDHCSGCGRQTAVMLSPIDDGHYCNDCLDAAGDQYIQGIIERERGK